MPRLLTLLILCCLSVTLSAQEITPYYDGKKWPYRHEGRHLNYRRLNRLLLSEPASAAVARRAGAPWVGSVVTGFAGGFLIGNQISRYLRRNQFRAKPTSTIVVLSGVFLAGISFQLEGTAKKHLREAIPLFNGARRKATDPTSLRLRTTANGAGFVLTF